VNTEASPITPLMDGKVGDTFHTAAFPVHDNMDSGRSTYSHMSMVDQSSFESKVAIGYNLDGPSTSPKINGMDIDVGKSNANDMEESTGPLHLPSPVIPFDARTYYNDLDHAKPPVTSVGDPVSSVSSATSHSLPFYHAPKPIPVPVPLSMPAPHLADSLLYSPAWIEILDPVVGSFLNPTPMVGPQSIFVEQPREGNVNNYGYYV